MKKFLKSFTKIIMVLLMAIVFYGITNETYAASTKKDTEALKVYIEDYNKKELDQMNKINQEKLTVIKSYISVPAKNTALETLNQEDKFVSFSSHMGLEENFKVEDIATNAFREYFDKYLNEDLSEDERLVDYFISGIFTYTKEETFKDGDDIEVRISAFVVPVSDNTIWAKNQEKRYGKFTNPENEKENLTIEGYYTERYYIHLVNKDGKYIISYMDTKPEGFDDFVERMKKHGIDLLNMNYAELINSSSEKEIISQAIEEHKYNSENTYLAENKISNIIVITCSVLLISIIVIYSKFTRKKKV